MSYACGNNVFVIVAVIAIIVFIPGYCVGVVSRFDNVDTKTKEGDEHIFTECPIIPIQGCSLWESNRNDWVFKNKDCKAAFDPEHKEETIYSIPKSGPPIPKGLDEVSRNKTSIVFYGSSHIRELHLAFIRLKRGLHYLDELEDNVTKISGGELLNLNPRVDICDPNKAGWKGSKYGLDFYNCGLPKKRLVPELGEHIAVGFKTFLHTPEADQIFLDWLEEVELRHPDVLIADVGIWGPRGTKTTESLRYDMTLTDEIDYYIHWLRDSFPNTKLVLVKGGSDRSLQGCEKQVNMELHELFQRDPDVYLLRKDLVMKRMPPDMECLHGCKGPVLTLLATILMDWLGLATIGSQKCLRSTIHI
jgi:hypothetical protein